jgi:hypothetical protein
LEFLGENLLCPALLSGASYQNQHFDYASAYVFAYSAAVKPHLPTIKD